MIRIRKRWRYIGYMALAVAAFWLALLVWELAARI
jgi:hypothetical protein